MLSLITGSRREVLGRQPRVKRRAVRPDPEVLERRVVLSTYAEVESNNSFAQYQPLN